LDLAAQRRISAEQKADGPRQPTEPRAAGFVPKKYTRESEREAHNANANTPPPDEVVEDRLSSLGKPDFTAPAPEISDDGRARLADRLDFLYGREVAEMVLPELLRLVRVHLAHKPEELMQEEKSFQTTCRFSEQDMMLITYGDMVQARDKTGLAALGEFLQYYRRGAPAFSILHVLPFFPSSSDRGYAVIDFHTVSPNIGSWGDIRNLGQVYRLMFDGVLNHASSQSKAFQEMLCENPQYKDFAISFRSA
jgi:sucrose phosphorylase